MLGMNEEKTLTWIEGFPFAHFFTTKNFGNVAEKYGKMESKELGRKIQEVVGREYSRIHLVPYGEKIQVGNMHTIKSFPSLQSFSQGIIMKRPPDDLPVVVFTLYLGDCYPMLLTDFSYLIIGLLHVGYEQARKRIIEKAIKLASRKWRIEPNMFIVGIGPGIKKCCYRVDLLKIILEQVENIGVERYYIAGPCTCCTKLNDKYLFFSHRRSQKTGEKEGRFAAVLTSKLIGSG